MDDLFTAALDVLADSPVGSAGTLTPLVGPAVPVIVLGLRQRDPKLGLPSPDGSAPGFTCELDTRQYPADPEGATLALPTEGLTLKVQFARRTTYTHQLDCYAV